MTIPENQLNTWSAQGSVTQSANTYATIKRVLEDSGAPFANRDYESFLQGSYGNDTNVYKDSDVDIVMKLNSTFYKDLSGLSESDMAAYRTAFSGAEYGYDEWKADVTNWLMGKFNGVKPGNKAIFIPGNGSRRDADVLPAAQFRRYYEFKGFGNQRYADGICFWSNGVRVENFPKQHSTNCTDKHQGTNSRFKPTVRIFKNMRNKLVEDGTLADGVAPSYFIEGLLYNVPNENFLPTHQDTFLACMRWIVQTDESKLVCANQLHWLIRENTHTSWPSKNFHAFLNAIWAQWDGWRSTRFI